MSLETTLEALKKYGVKAVLVIWILRSETRLNVVEDKLYNCYATMNFVNANHRKTAETRIEYFAILPNEVNLRNTKRHTQARG